MVGAIIIGDETAALEDTQSPSCAGSCRRPWATVEVLGKAPIARLAESLRTELCDAVSVIVNDPQDGQEVRTPHPSVADLAAARFAEYKGDGFDTVLVARCGAYVELDAAEMLSFHGEQGSIITRAFAGDGPLDLWMVDASALPCTPLMSALLCTRPAVYRSKGYVNRLRNARDFRQLVLDSFSSRCRLRPQGSEIKPRIWNCDGAQIDRSARVVAPAFIGRNVHISGECLITRGSNVESNSRVEFGTAVEDSSILSDSYVGIGLELSHSIVDGHNLLNLRHNVSLEITDPVVMRKNTVRGGDRQSLNGESRQMALSSTE